MSSKKEIRYSTNPEVIGHINELYDLAGNYGVLSAIVDVTKLPLRALDLIEREGRMVVGYSGAKSLHQSYAEIFLAGGWVGNILVPRDTAKITNVMKVFFLRRQGVGNKEAWLNFSPNGELLIEGDRTTYNGELSQYADWNRNIVGVALKSALNGLAGFGPWSDDDRLSLVR